MSKVVNPINNRGPKDFIFFPFTINDLKAFIGAVFFMDVYPRPELLGDWMLY